MRAPVVAALLVAVALAAAVLRGFAQAFWEAGSSSFHVLAMGAKPPSGAHQQPVTALRLNSLAELLPVFSSRFPWPKADRRNFSLPVCPDGQLAFAVHSAHECATNLGSELRSVANAYTVSVGAAH